MSLLAILCKYTPLYYRTIPTGLLCGAGLLSTQDKLTSSTGKRCGALYITLAAINMALGDTHLSLEYSVSSRIKLQKAIKGIVSPYKL